MNQTSATIPCPSCSTIIRLPAPGYCAAVCPECSLGALWDDITGGWSAIEPPAGYRMVPTSRQERVLPGDVYFDFDFYDGRQLEEITTFDYPLIARPMAPEIGVHEQNGPHQLTLWT